MLQTLDGTTSVSETELTSASDSKTPRASMAVNQSYSVPLATVAPPSRQPLPSFAAGFMTRPAISAGQLHPTAQFIRNARPVTNSQVVIRQLLQRSNAVVIRQTPPSVRGPIYTVSNAGLAGHRIQLVIGPAVVRSAPVEVPEATSGEETQVIALPETVGGPEECLTMTESENVVVWPNGESGVEHKEDVVCDDDAGVLILAEDEAQVRKAFSCRGQVLKKSDRFFVVLGMQLLLVYYR